MADVLKTVTDRFCLYSNARKGRQNGRQYVLSAVKAMLESKETQEGLRLGELFGYYGHGRRQLTGKLEVPETSVIMVEGRPVVIDNV
ncbi:head processing protein, partial [Escherichia coli]|nr:head processing protein [Escherichia coli]